MLANGDTLEELLLDDETDGVPDTLIDTVGEGDDEDDVLTVGLIVDSGDILADALGEVDVLGDPLLVA